MIFILRKFKFKNLKRVKELQVIDEPQNEVLRNAQYELQQKRMVEKLLKGATKRKRM